MVSSDLSQPTCTLRPKVAGLDTEAGSGFSARKSGFLVWPKWGHGKGLILANLGGSNEFLTLHFMKRVRPLAAQGGIADGLAF